jgi:hypothetical protein
MFENTNNHMINNIFDGRFNIKIPPRIQGATCVQHRYGVSDIRILEIFYICMCYKCMFHKYAPYVCPTYVYVVENSSSIS